VAIHTVGHGTLAADTFAELLQTAGDAQVVDVRTFPGSRHNPQFGRDAMERWLPAAGLAYGWLPELGGRRRPRAGSRHVALRNDAFRAYADHMETDEFHHGVERLLGDLADDQAVVMCSESVWWRCHRRLLADHLVLVHDVEVVHLMHDGRLTPHPLTEGARLEGDRVVYDVGVTTPLLPDPGSGDQRPSSSSWSAQR
jgi:uncharacterized protein (DUF488 family)